VTLLATLKDLLRNNFFKVGLSIMVFLVLLSTVGPLVAPFKPDMAVGEFNLPPSLRHILGTDPQGRDVFTILVYSVGPSLMLGLMTGSIATSIAFTLGLIAGFKRGLVDDLLTNLANILLVIPTLPILVMLASYTRIVTIPMMVLTIAVFTWAWTFRSLRSQVMSLREREFVNVARVSGQGDLEIAFREIAPNMLSLIAISFINIVGFVVAYEVGLEIIGLGPPNMSTLGTMLWWISYTGGMARGEWWWVFPTIGCVVAIFLGLQFMNMGLDRVLNPRLSKT
jgi:peptide/nickel transport system permease protein